MSDFATEIVIRPVSEEEQATLGTVAKWLWEQWGSPDNREYWASWVQYSIAGEGVPQTLVAFSEDQPVGTVSLWRCDLQSRQDLFPWVGGLYVVPEWRHKGLAIQLSLGCCQAAVRAGFTEVFMFAASDAQFEKEGWVFMGLAPDEHDRTVRLYRKPLQ